MGEGVGAWINRRGSPDNRAAVRYARDSSPRTPMREREREREGERERERERERRRERQGACHRARAEGARGCALESEEKSEREI